MDLHAETFLQRIHHAEILGDAARHDHVFHDTDAVGKTDDTARHGTVDTGNDIDLVRAQAALEKALNRLKVTGRSINNL